MSVKDRHTDLPTAFVALAIAAVAAVAVWQAREFSRLGSIFPLVIGVTLLLASLGVFASSLMSGVPANSRPVRDVVGMRNSLALIAVLIVWALTLEWAGFTVSSWFCFVALALIADHRRPTLRRSALYGIAALVVVGGLQLLFQQILNVRLP